MTGAWLLAIRLAPSERIVPFQLGSRGAIGDPDGEKVVVPVSNCPRNHTIGAPIDSLRLFRQHVMCLWRLEKEILLRLISF